MSLSLASRTLENVWLIDDDPNLRAGYRWHVDDLDLTPVEEEGPISAGSQFVNKLSGGDAVICDLNLKTRNYSSQNGDELVSAFYSRGVPAVLCTRYAEELPDPIRHRRRQIPVILSSSDLSADTIREGFLTCLNEFKGIFSRQRKPWRAMVRIESSEELAGGYFRLGLVVPAWDPSSALTFVVPVNDNHDLADMCVRVRDGEELRVFAQVNLGAEKAGDIYIDQWTLR